jgi:hypothetical protein
MRKEQEVYILSPVRYATPEQSIDIAEYVEKVKKDGDHVFNPVENAPQLDPTGYYIVMTELAALDKAAKSGGRVDMLWNLGGTPSEGSRVDLGMAIALGLEYRLVKVFNDKDQTGPQIAYQIISNSEDHVNALHTMLDNILQSKEVTIDWDTEMITENQEWQRISLGLVLGCLAKNPDLKIHLGKLHGEDPPDKKSYPKVIKEIERRQQI